MINQCNKIASDCHVTDQFLHQSSFKMKFYALFLLITAGHMTTLVTVATSDPAANQLPAYASSSAGTSYTATNFLGAPIPSMTASQTPDKTKGPILLTDTNYIEMMAHFTRERIPERVVHAHGTSAHGRFRVTHDITRYTKANLFSRIGQETDIFIRFSTVGGESGSADTVHDPRGFAIKFYTRDGNLDLVGNNLPVFAIRDPILFPSFVHISKRNPVTHLPDRNMFWDFRSLRPETTHFTMQLFSDLGIPASLRTMDGSGVHTFKFVNARDEEVFVRFTHKSQQGIQNLTWAEADVLAGTNPNHYQKDLYNAIETGNYPKWTTYIQIMQPNETSRYQFAFDPTQIWPEEQFPLMQFGEFTLDRNPSNYFAEVEQVAFDPGNLVPGIEMSQDRLLQGRSFAYSDAQRYRLGINFLQIPINFPKNQTRGIHNFMRDGAGCIFSQNGSPNYFPNSFNGPTIEYQGSALRSRDHVNDFIGRYDNGFEFYDNFGQANQFYLKLRQDEKDRLVSNILTHLSGASVSVQQRVLDNIFSNLDQGLYTRIASGLGLSVTKKNNNSNGGKRSPRNAPKKG